MPKKNENNLIEIDKNTSIANSKQDEQLSSNGKQSSKKNTKIAQKMAVNEKMVVNNKGQKLDLNSEHVAHQTFGVDLESQTNTSHNTKHMQEIQLSDFAREINISIDNLIEKFAKIGMKKSQNSMIEDEDKQKLLDFLATDNKPKLKLKLTKKTDTTTSEQASNITIKSTKQNNISVEIKQKKKLVKIDLDELNKKYDEARKETKNQTNIENSISDVDAKSSNIDKNSPIDPLNTSLSPQDTQSADNILGKSNQDLDGSTQSNFIDPSNINTSEMNSTNNGADNDQKQPKNLVDAVCSDDVKHITNTAANNTGINIAISHDVAHKNQVTNDTISNIALQQTAVNAKNSSSNEQNVSKVHASANNTSDMKSDNKDTKPQNKKPPKLNNQKPHLNILEEDDEEQDKLLNDTIASHNKHNTKAPKLAYNTHNANNKNKKFSHKAPHNKNSFYGHQNDSYATQGHQTNNQFAVVKPEIHIPEIITVAELAHKMSIKASEVIKILFNMGTMVTINQSIDQTTAILVCEEMGYKYKTVLEYDPESILKQIEDDSSSSNFDDKIDIIDRAPIVTVMGHVDHGKTSLLDYIRKTKVASKEAGGITQAVGAYHVETPNGMITFLDTPGHEAFTALRARGAKLTDIVVLVVAADDGIMPQTIEAIHHAKAANVPIVVAINKMDKPNADPERVKNELTKYELVAEEWGGDVICTPVSAFTGFGIDDLLASILLQADLLELKANIKIPAKAVIIESKLDKGRGVLVNCLIQNGVMRRGDIILAGATYGRVKAMFNELGKHIDSAGPSMPVQVLGFASMPASGEELMVLPDEKKAREIAAFREQRQRVARLDKQQSVRLENLFQKFEQNALSKNAAAASLLINKNNNSTNANSVNKSSDKDEVIFKNLSIIIKSDAQASYEAIAHALKQLNNNEIKVQIIHAAIGGITESDVNLAIASSAIIIGFNARAETNTRRLAEAYNIEIRYYNVIYDAIEDVKLAMIGMLSPEQKELITGTLEVRKLFSIDKTTIAGCMVINGVVKRSSSIRVIRDNLVIHSSTIDTMRRVKEDIKEAKEGYECGIVLKDYNDIKERDLLEAFEVVEVKKTSLN